MAKLSLSAEYIFCQKSSSSISECVILAEGAPVKALSASLSEPPIVFAYEPQILAQAFSSS